MMTERQKRHLIVDISLLEEYLDKGDKSLIEVETTALTGSGDKPYRIMSSAKDLPEDDITRFVEAVREYEETARNERKDLLKGGIENGGLRYGNYGQGEIGKITVRECKDELEAINKSDNLSDEEIIGLLSDATIVQLLGCAWNPITGKYEICPRAISMKFANDGAGYIEMRDGLCLLGNNGTMYSGDKSFYRYSRGLARGLNKLYPFINKESLILPTETTEGGYDDYSGSSGLFETPYDRLEQLQFKDRSYFSISSPATRLMEIVIPLVKESKQFDSDLQELAEIEYGIVTSIEGTVGSTSDGKLFPLTPTLQEYLVKEHEYRDQLARIYKEIFTKARASRNNYVQ